jgi:hypothetical protein
VFEDISPYSNFQDVYKCLIKEISMIWHTKVHPVSLPPRDLYLSITVFASIQRMLEIYPFT